MNRGLVAVLFGITILINLVTLKPGHNWGGDFSQYIINASNIANFKDFNSGIALENPFSYPPGFALILAPFVKIFGINFQIFKVLNVVFWYGAVYLFYLMFRRRWGQDLAVWSAFLLAISSDFFIYKQNVLSDNPFLFFITLAVYIFERYEPFTDRRGQRAFIGYLIIVSFAMFIRSAAVVLFIATFFYLGVIKKDWRRAGTIIVVLLITWAIQTACCGSNASFFGQMLQDPGQFADLVIERSAMPFRTLLCFFCPDQTGLTARVASILDQIITFITPVLYLIMIGMFIRQIFKRQISLIGCFTVLYLLAILVWSGFHADPRVLVRLAWPIAGFALIYIVEFLLWLGKKLRRPGAVLSYLVISFLIFLNIWNISVSFPFDDDVLVQKENQEIFQWVKKNLTVEEHYLFWHARVMALMTQRVGAPPYSAGSADVLERIMRLNISYLILIKGVDDGLIQFFTGNPQLAMPAWENASYLILKVNRGL